MQQELPLVSAIIPVYNGEKFLSETIESVLAQTYSNIECIVVNDGSTDGTAEVAKAFGDRIRYHEKRNGGVSSARNLGISVAAGELIAFLDADDLWLPEKIAKQVTVYQQDRRVGLVYSAVRTVNDEGHVISEISNKFGKDALLRILLLETPVYLTMTGLAPRAVFDVVGNFDERLSTSADADMACRIALRYKMKAVDEPLAYYRQHPGQMHLNLTALERDANLMFENVFGSEYLPCEIAAIRPSARASLEGTLSIGYLSKGEYAAGLTHLFRGLRQNVPATVRKFVAALSGS